MDYELTTKGRRYLKTDTREAFSVLDKIKLRNLAHIMYGKSQSSSLRLLKVLDEYCPHIFPILDSNDKIIPSPLTDIQALLFYDSLIRLKPNRIDFNPDISSLFSPSNFGDNCLELLEAYLVHQNLIKEDSCELFGFLKK